MSGLERTALDEKSLILVHVRALLEQLDWAESSLRTTGIEPRIMEAARVGFAVLFKQRRNELTRMQASIAKGAIQADAWKQLRTFRRSCAELFKECLEFLGGAMLRAAHKKDDICEIADALLIELSRNTPIQWKGVTLLAEANFFTETTGLIRLPFPDYGIWNLPIAVHELGHFIGPRIPDGMGGFPFQALQQNVPASLSVKGVEQEKSHLRELFSDLFATYALGPAYACSCILLRFDPQDATACEDSETHPSHAKRVHFILKALDQMSKTTEGWPYANMIDHLQALWDRILTRAGHEKCLDEKKIPPLNYQLFELYPILAKFVPTVQYDGWDRAVALSNELSLGRKPAALLQAEDTIADVLNAAWLWRLRQNVENSNTVHQVNLEAIALCREVIGVGR
ncbi:MAG TPA: hypothetical protein VNG71_08585 [Pyrinomonadaceae bacterium]|nr:hypothetical protein [Pyrinomonadaceae bacterium]